MFYKAFHFCFLVIFNPSLLPHASYPLASLLNWPKINALLKLFEGPEIHPHKANQCGVIDASTICSASNSNGNILMTTIAILLS